MSPRWFGPETSLAVLGLAALAILAWSFRRAEWARSEDAAGQGAGPAGLAAWAVLGLAALAAGALAVAADFVAVSLPLLAAGFGAWTIVARGHERRGHEGEAVRRVVGLTRAGLSAAWLAGLLLVANLFAYKYGDRPIDLSRDRAFSLSSLTRNQLAALDKPVTFTAFFGVGPRATPQLERVGELLGLYRDAAPRWVSVRTLNPFTEPEAFEELARGIPDVALSRGGGVVIQYGAASEGARLLVRNEELFGAGPGPEAAESGRFATTFRGEDAVTSALARLRQGDRVRVGFTAGHGEPSTAPTDPRQQGVGRWRARLLAVGAEVGEVDTRRGEVPPDLAVLIIVAPRTPFQPEEMARVRNFLDRGKPLLVVAGDAAGGGLGELLSAYRIQIVEGVVLDPELNSEGRAALVYAPLGPPLRHPVVDSLAGRSVLLPRAAGVRAVAPGDAAGAVPGAVPEPLVRTGPRSWLEVRPGEPDAKFDAGVDQAGPIAVAMAVSAPPPVGLGAPAATPGAGPAPLPRLAVIGSGFFADDRFLEIEPTNLDLLMNAVQWLRGRPEQLGIAPKAHVATTLAASPARRARLVTVPTVLSGVVILGLGLGTYLTRRR